MRIAQATFEEKPQMKIAIKLNKNMDILFISYSDKALKGTIVNLKFPPLIGGEGEGHN